MDKARDALVQEARELLEAMEQTLARVAAEGENPESVNEIFRVAHTIKGSASLFSFERLISFTHLLEGMLERIRRDSLALDPPMVVLLVECGDYIAELVDAIVARREETEPDEGKRARLERGLRRVLERQEGGLPSARDIKPRSSGAAEAGRRQAFVKVPVSRLDALIDLVGELVIAGAAASQVARRQRNAHFEEAAQTMTERVAQLRDVALTLRMVPIDGVFQRFPRIVRSVAAELGKDIRLRLDGTDTELDRSMIEKLADPLMHLIRNAIDHGIEPLAERLDAGKPASGVLTLGASHEAGCVLVEVSDDGRGLDRGRIRRKAVELGLLDSDACLPDEAIDRFVLEPGFSTAERVTRLSGRGVGMDVVRKEVESLRGEVEIRSEPGRGTTVRLRLPLTLAIIDGFLVQVGDSTFVLPLDTVVECVDASDCEPDRGGVEFKGEHLPCLRLAGSFGLDAAADGGRRNVVVVQNGRQQRAVLVVDALLGEFQTVIRPLGVLFDRVGGFNGSTILPDGRVALILDVPQLIERALAADAARTGEPDNA